MTRKMTKALCMGTNPGSVRKNTGVFHLSDCFVVATYFREANLLSRGSYCEESYLRMQLQSLAGQQAKSATMSSLKTCCKLHFNLVHDRAGKVSWLDSRA